MKKLSIAVLVASLAVATPVIAEEAPADGPTIKGGVQLNTTANQDISAAIGNEAETDQQVGDIDSGTISGDIEDTTIANEDVTAAIGNKSTAKQKVGTIGE